MDILGSVVVITFTALSLLSFGNPCQSPWTRDTMLAVFLLSSLVVLVAIFRRSMTAAQRFLVFGVHLMLRLVLQFSVLMPKLRATGVHSAMYLHTLSFVLLMVGSILNISRFPERLFTRVHPLHSTHSVASEIQRVVAPSNLPGDDAAGRHHGTSHSLYRWPASLARLLDFVGNSHNIWHVLSTLSCYATLQGVVADYEEHDWWVRAGTPPCQLWK